MSFSWVPFYKELAGKVLEFEERQNELIALLNEMTEQGLPVIGLNDYEVRGRARQLRQIDPFTFFATWNRGEESNRRQICAFLKTKWSLEAGVPTDFDGVPVVNPRLSWFLPYEQSRGKDDVGILWRVARAAYSEKLEAVAEDNFAHSLQIGDVGVAKLTTGLFWISPKCFLPLNKNIVSRLKEVDVEIHISDLNEKKLTLTRYQEILNQIYAKLGLNHLEIAYSLALTKTKTTGETMPLLSTPLNQILYGPLGTGKTYNSIRRAVEIIDGKIGDDPKARFEELRKAGHIEFVTFHQSFSYEEFIEGLRPLIGEENGQVRYEIRDGILKTIALRSMLALSTVVMAQENPKAVSFEEVWANLEKQIDSQQMEPVPGLTKGSRYKLYFEKNNLVGQNLEGGKYIPYQSSEEQQKEVWEKFKDRRTINCTEHWEFKPKESASRGFIVAIFNYMKSLEAQMSTNTAIPTKNRSINYVLIIDEINRGNISKILGELITLLEDDKRIGAPNELRLTLPTSGETFALPPNLFILGTMNTSDKSLAQLDVALRRRFEFEEMAPDFSVFKQFLEQVPVLQELNNRLEWALDREHRLGHAYFMKVDSEDAFNAVFQSKILPLLLEYFPHDFATLRAVLGEKSDGFLREMTKPEGFTSGGKKYRWWFEKGVENFSAFAQLKLNYGL